MYARDRPALIAADRADRETTKIGQRARKRKDERSSFVFQYT